MFRRIVSVGILTTAMFATTLGAAVSASPSQAAAGATATAHPTVVVHVRPVTSTGKLRHGYTITHRRAHASCSFGSEAIGDAYRCFSGNLVIDPCWVSNRKAFVVCLPDAWSHQAIRLHVTKGYQNGGFGSGGVSYPWGVRQASGTRCSWLQGASGEVKGKRISYGCTSTTVLIGHVNKKPARWTIKRARATGGGHYTVTGTVQLRKAWFGKPSLKG